VGGSRPAFEGVTGRIAFDSAGDVPDKAVVIGVVRNGRLVTDASQ
jgi:ABC-type branched-subunit amino acid transport system substrate-binding protein